MGSVGQSDVSGAMPKSRNGNRVLLKNIQDVHKENIEHLLSKFGIDFNFDIVDNADSRNHTILSFETAQQAHSAVMQLNGYELHDVKLEAELMTEESSGHLQSTRSVGAHAGPSFRATTYPLRILIPNELVGAVIGKQGVVIRGITTQCKVRIDVHGKDSSAVIEKMISIFGQPDNSSSACRQILNVIHSEPVVQSLGSVLPLKMLVDDRYCGRIIGKEGKIIKKIRDDTNTKIVISSVDELAVVYPDRVITIQGTVDNMVDAQAAISVKLAECIEKDMQSTNGLGNMMMAQGTLPGGPYARHSYNTLQAAHAGYSSYASTPIHVDSCQIVVPDKAVGAIIGAGGTMIKQIMEDSGAHVTVEAKKDGDETSSTLERIVTIRGNTDACWKASYFVFEKVKDESAGRGAGGDCADVKLCTMMSVPRSITGRIIGRQGKNVREIQRMTGATVKLSDDPAASDETTAEVYGTFMATQAAHARIRALMSDELIDGTSRQPAATHRAIQQLA